MSDLTPGQELDQLRLSESIIKHAGYQSRVSTQSTKPLGRNALEIPPPRYSARPCVELRVLPLAENKFPDAAKALSPLVSILGEEGLFEVCQSSDHKKGDWANCCRCANRRKSDRSNTGKTVC